MHAHIHTLTHRERGGIGTRKMRSKKNKHKRAQINAKKMIIECVFFRSSPMQEKTARNFTFFGNFSSCAYILIYIDYFFWEQPKVMQLQKQQTFDKVFGPKGKLGSKCGIFPNRNTSQQKLKNHQKQTYKMQKKNAKKSAKIETHTKTLPSPLRAHNNAYTKWPFKTDTCSRRWISAEKDLSSNPRITPGKIWSRLCYNSKKKDTTPRKNLQELRKLTNLCEFCSKILKL